MKPGGHTSSVWRAMRLSVTALFFGFLTISTPHQVHHVFDRHSPSDHHHSSDHHSDSHNRNQPNGEQNCVFQIVSSRCHAVSASWLPLIAFSILIESVTIPSERTVPSFSPSGPLQIRAPPKI
jgi:hypothetical protein